MNTGNLNDFQKYILKKIDDIDEKLNTLTVNFYKKVSFWSIVGGSIPALLIVNKRRRDIFIADPRMKNKNSAFVGIRLLDLAPSIHLSSASPNSLFMKKTSPIYS